MWGYRWIGCGRKSGGKGAMKMIEEKRIGVKKGVRWCWLSVVVVRKPVFVKNDMARENGFACG